MLKGFARPTPVVAARLWRSIDAMGRNHSYELGLLDNILVVFVGIIIGVASLHWVQQVPFVVFMILACVSVTAIPISLAINEQLLSWRILFNVFALVIAYSSDPIIMWASRHDLAPHHVELMALPAGVTAWVLTREVSIFLLNIRSALAKR